MIQLVYYLFLSVLIVIELIVYANGARILAIVPTPSYSHQIPFQPLWAELSRRGHQVVTITTNPINDPTLTNLTEIDVSFSYSLALDGRVNQQLQKGELSTIEFIELFKKAVSDITIEQLKQPQLQDLINNEHVHFDVVLVEIWFPVMFAFSERFNCPLIGITSLDATYSIHRIMGNPTHPVLFPEFTLPFYSELNFKQRLISTVYQLFMDYYKAIKLDVRDQKIIETFFVNNTKHKSELERSMSLLFTNTNPILHGNRPLAPNTIAFGGAVQVKSKQELPEEITEFLNNTTKGAIYFSLGTNIKAKYLDADLINTFIDTFRVLPYKILWKFDLDRIENLPDNVKIVEWVPQQDVLRHPNVKLFITQGGLQSIEESIFNLIPMVGIPMFADQISNVRQIVEKNMGVYIDYKTAKVQDLKDSINEVINNRKYRNSVRKTAQLIKDQPMSGLEKTIWWTEYVIRHKGAEHLANRGRNLPLYQYFLLDVIGLFAVVILVIISICIVLIKVVYRGLKIAAIKLKQE